MAILFDVPRTAASNGFKQKGPTCWYYGAKMLVTMHNLRGDAAFDLQWKALHETRKVMTELATEQVEGGPEYSEQLVSIRQRLKSEHDRHLEQLHLVATAKERPEKGWYQEHEYRKSITVLGRALGGKTVEKATRHVPVILAAHARMMAATSMTRADLFNLFLPGVFVHSRIALADCTAVNIEARLLATGPFYAEGDVFSRRVNRNPLPGFNPAPDADTRAEVHALDADSPHVVVVLGIVGDNLYYKDPNDSAQVRIAPFDMFRTGWARGGDCGVITVTCPHHDDAQRGGCVHVSARELPVPVAPAPVPAPVPIV